MKGIIIAAGYGTRFLPITKTVPKEMLPILTRPSIAYVIDEFLASGIDELIVVTSRRKKCLDDYFDREVELEELFKREGKADRLALIAPPDLKVSFVRQAEMRGTGHALLAAAPLLGGEPAIVAYPDDLHVGTPSLSAQLVETWKATSCSVLATMHEPGDVSRYGVVDPAPDGVHIRGFVEKPPRGTEPSHDISLGRYLYTPEFFDYLAEGWRRHEKGEYFHTVALDRQIAQGHVAFRRAEGTRLDTGEPSGYLEAILWAAWADPSLRAVVEHFVDTERKAR